MQGIALLFGYLIGAILFMDGGCRLLLLLIAKPDRKHPLNPQSARRTFAVVPGGFGGVALWTTIVFFGWLVWRAHVMAKTGAG